MEKVTRRVVRWIAGALAAWGVVEFGLTHSYPHGTRLRVGRRARSERGSTPEKERPAQA